jgi:GNAT superfamily N-acetyltransferase
LHDVTVRLALATDGPAIEALIERSAVGLSGPLYGEAQIPSVERFVATLDPRLIEDRTYFVATTDSPEVPLAACGGWSWRATLYAGRGDAAGGAEALCPATDAARVRAMFVHPEFARRGLGRRSLTLCEAAARAAGFGRLELMATLPGVPLELPDGAVVGGVRMGKAT